MDNKLKTMLSFCKRSGNILSGDVQVSNALSKKKAKLVIIATDVSENTTKNFVDKCDYYKIDCIQYGLRDEISSSIGMVNKTVFCITDENFAKTIKNLIMSE